MRLPLQFPGLLIASLLVLLSSDGIAAEYDLQVIEHETPARLDQLENVDVLLVLMNRGDRPWTPDRFNVSYHWLAPDGETIVFDGLRTPIPERVDPGEALELTVRLQSPPSTGPALLQWDVVEESVTWISERDPTPPEPIPVTIEPAELEHAFSLLSESTPHIIWADDTSEVGLKLRNDGAATWGPGRKINVSYHWKHPSEAKAVFEGMRTPVPGVISEGEHLEIEARLRSPRRAGIYELQWDMVEEGVTWFQRVDPSPPPPVTVLVLPNPLTGPTVATAAAIICLSIVAFVFYRRGVPSRVIDVAVVLDLVWLFFALSAKQSVVLQEAGRSPIEGSGWIVISGVAAITIVVALFPSRLRPWIAAGVNAVASFVILADVIHIRFFRDMLSFASIGAAHQMGEISSGIASLFASRDLWLFIDLVPGIALALLVRRLASESRRRYARWPALLLVPLLLPGIVVATRIGTAEKGKFVQTFQNIFIVQEIGPLNYHLLDAWRETASALSSPELTETRREQIIEWFEKTSDRRAGVGEMFGRARGKNLLMIQAESMQGFVIGLEVEGQEITPNLNHWSRSNAIWLSNCADQTAQGRTSDAEFAIHTSLIPPRQGTVAFRHGDNRYVGLADVLHDHGYSTLSAIPFDRAFWNRRVTLPEYGYHTNLFRGDFEPGLNVGWGLNDRAFLEQMVPKLVALDRPFAALLITLSNHHPYAHFPQELKVLDLGDLEGTSIGNYLHGMHFLDSAMGNFVGMLQDEELLNETVIAFWGDHGAGLPWDYAMGDLLGIRPTEPMFYRVSEVPVLISIGGGSSAFGERDMPCGQVDLAPTLLGLLGIDASPYPFVGRNLFGNPGEGPVMGQYTVWFDDEHLYLDKGPELEAGRCYRTDSLQIVPVERCREGEMRAKETMQISRDVILHDLHVPIARHLSRSDRPPDE